jgi:cytochrome c oxidase assembly factor CtaG
MSPVVLAVGLAAAVLYELGRRRLSGGRRRREGGWRTEAFYAGLVAAVVATQPPLDGLADRSFSGHMVQHLLLQMVAPPLLVLGAPWLPVWRMLPAGGRRGLGAWLACSRGAVPLRVLAGTLGRPAVAWVLFVGAIALSHMPRIFDLALRDAFFHEAEHALFLGLGLLFWSRAFDSPPFRARLRPPQAVVFFATAIAAESLLALAILQQARSPLYAPYSAEGHRPDGLTALADQQLGGAVMLEPASLPLLIALIWSLKRWLGAAQPAAVAGSSRRPPRPRGRRPGTSSEARMQTARNVSERRKAST